MRHARIQQAKPERCFAERIVAVIIAIAMLGGMGYATTSAAMADNAEHPPVAGFGGAFRDSWSGSRGTECGKGRAIDCDCGVGWRARVGDAACLAA